MIRFKSFWYGNSSLDLRQVIVKTRKLSSNVYSRQQPQHNPQIQRILMKGIFYCIEKVIKQDQKDCYVLIKDEVGQESKRRNRQF